MKMYSDLQWILNQQYVCNPGRASEVSFTDKLIDQFSCTRDDQYNIQGTMGMPLPPFVACFSTDLQGNILGIADEDGRVKLIDTAKRTDSAIIKEWSAHSNAVFDLAWIEKESKMVTASGDQTARLWDIEKCVTIGNFRGHTCSLKSIAVQPKSSRIFLTGARDGNIMVWDTRCNLRNGYHTPINTIRKSHERAETSTANSSVKKKKKKKTSCQADTKQSVTAAVFLDDCQIISTGACDGAIKYWDIRKNYSSLKGEAIPYHVINFSDKGPRKHGFSSLILNSTHSRLFSVCTNSIIYEFSTMNLSSRPTATYQGHLVSSFYVKAALSPDDRYLLCGSGDNNAYIWRTDQPNESPWILSGHSGEVTSVAWSPNNGEKLVTCSDDNTFRIWRPFQVNSDPSSSCGMVKRKTSVEDNKSTDKSSNVILQEDVLELDLPQRKPKCYCNSLNMTSNKRVKVRWNIGVVHHAKDTDSKPRARSKSRNLPSPFTVVTPKGLDNLTPTREDLNASPSCTPTARRTINSKDTLQTPKTSRSFMETWLKSPHTPGNKSPVVNGLKEAKFLFPDTDVYDYSRDKMPELESVQLNKGFSDTQCDQDLRLKHSNHELAAGNTAVSTLLQSKKKGSTKPRRKSNPGQCLNIKTMLLSLKRKCNSPLEESNLNGKHLKTGEESLLVLDIAKIKNNTSDKENVANNYQSLTTNETNNMGTLPKSTALSNGICKQKDVKDILDYAEESAGFY